MADEPIALRTLLRQRHWKYATFCVEYDKAARTLDPGLTGTYPSRAQFQRWLAGDLRRLPYPDACRVLEVMFPGWKIEELFARHSEEELTQLARLAVGEPQRGPVAIDPLPAVDLDELLADRFSDVTAVYATRSEFISKMPAHTLFDHAISIRACGLSLNVLCQQYSEESLRRLAEGGTQIQCLFLDPDGSAIQAREKEEKYRRGTLSDLTRINIRSMEDRVRDLLSDEARARLELATYDETIRFNIIIIDERMAIVQPYMPALRGIDSPTFVLDRKWENRGLFPMFEAVLSSLWTRAKKV
jgi:hypothetical protein